MATTGEIQSQAYGISPEERQVRSERNRVQGLINKYYRNPSNYNPRMVQTLERMAMQYGLMFKKVIEPATTLENVGAFAGGVLDSAAFGFIPDEWYSSEKTREAANAGRIGGAGLQILGGIAAAPLTGGASLGATARGVGSAISAAKGLGKVGAAVKGAGKLATAGAGALPVGRMTSGAISQGRKALMPYGAGQGWKWAEKGVKAAERTASSTVLKQARNAVDNAGDLSSVVKGQTLSKEQIGLLTKRITRKYGEDSKVTQNFLEQLKSSKSVGSLDGVSPKNLIKMANSLNKRHHVKPSNIKNLLKRAGANDSDDNVAFIVKKLGEENITRLDEKAVGVIMKLAAEGSKQATKAATSLGDINKWQALSAVGLGAGAASSLVDYTPSREELMRQEDPYDPYNQ